ncbi:MULTISPECIES: hemolysin family protein [Bacillus]|uniref:Magnesium and cobalt efflux protein corC n=1 Tax=Bacillus cereus (strain ATCC 14579 / DSM 31 / CCUG 7414 / JCM 2152 / NBRC 15305 / NCIMB 9373 / NCTC 2599 / NRRL B-3711) TaxID=226900 RepID=Q81B36_BACCR|nr:hemolysin family protein [Bacillus cereus]AAP10295.1 Magnesium and cobalt efflux protein corC [Bacillus cereus ATCC 14579]ETT87003.1 magnesium and cobalt efflux protein corC [Bacillus cereus]KZD77174.1 Hemolysins and related protein containing CBS domain [Bacillus cereus]MCC3285579.1 hemolysin family protein [Bacillus cereus]MEB9993222.1 hemolysin family protein [Bacillus cereus]
MEIFNLVMVAILIAFTGFFVAAEFAIVKVRSSRIDQLVAEGKRGALAAKKVTTNLDEYLSACQLGITVTAMGLGWLGEPTIEKLLHPLFEKWNLNPSISSVLTFGLAFMLMTYLHVVVGELAPKTMAIQKAEKVTLLFAAPLMMFYKVMYPFIWVLNGSARVITGLFGLKPASEHEVAHTEEELRLILSDSYESGEINQAEYKYVNNIFEFDNRIAKEIMVPRTEIVGFYLEDSVEEHMKVIQNERYTRYPIFGEDKDDIIGMVNVKDFFIRYMTEDQKDLSSIRSYMRPIIEVMETTPIHDLLLQMQKKRIPMAVLYDEYGGTAGIVTLEDILEEIVGEIRDEYDEDEAPPIQHVNEQHIIVDGKVLISEVKDLFGLHIEEDDVDTIGGWIMMQNHEIEEGQHVEAEGFEFKVLEKDAYQIKRVEIRKMEQEQEEEKAATV